MLAVKVLVTFLATIQIVEVSTNDFSVSARESCKRKVHRKVLWIWLFKGCSKEHVGREA